MVKIKGPIKIKRGQPLPEEILKAAGKNLPFEAKGWKSSENEHLVTGKAVKVEEIIEKESVEGIVQKPEKNDSNKLLDNYLDQNTKTVIKALKDDQFDKKTLEKLYSLEKLDKNREKVLELIRKLVED